SEVLLDIAGERPLALQLRGLANVPCLEPERTGFIARQLLEALYAFSPAGAEVSVRVEQTSLAASTVLHFTLAETSSASQQRGFIHTFNGEGVEEQAKPVSLALGLAKRATAALKGSLGVEAEQPPALRLELPSNEMAARRAAEDRQKAASRDAQALRAIQDLRALRSVTRHERVARKSAEAQELRTVEDFRAAHAQAVNLTHQLDKAYLETISAIAKSIEARDYYTGGHVERVRRYGLELAEDVGLEAGRLRELEFGAILHDVGKIGVPDAILTKAGPLDANEWQVMQQHPEIGRRVLEGIGFLARPLDVVLHHHERWDGHGYPQGLVGDGIPLVARIVAVVDAFDAMTSDRPYRQGLPREVALGEIRKGQGAQFDPDLAEAFLKAPPSLADASAAYQVA
ncbi:MAG: HD-GYP domain-containing protein, partial [Chloroflexota bacterium]